MNRVKVKRVLRIAVLLVLGSMAYTAIQYSLFALVFSTATERKLKDENRMYEKSFAILNDKEALLCDVIAGLQYKDSDIYKRIFHSPAPNVDPMSLLDFLYASDTIPDTRLSGYVQQRADSLLALTPAVEEKFNKIFLTLSSKGYSAPPMTMPIKNLGYTQVGASVGKKFSPYYNTYVKHRGLDLIAAYGTAVYATAEGVVEKATDIPKSMGKTVQIRHEGGYVTRYANLGHVDVKPGQKVKRGRKIGMVGMSGRSYAPHLHYEILKGGNVVNPVNHVFASVSTAEYANMLYMSINTEQSMD